MQSARIHSKLAWAAMLILSVAIFLGLAGCGGNNSSSTTTSNNNPTPGSTNTGGTGTTGGTNTGGTGSGGTGSGTTGGGSTTSATDITGTIVDSQTGKPIAGTVIIDLEAPAPGDYVTVAEVAADANGKFTFANVAAGKPYAVVISASAGENYYLPTIIAGGGTGAPDSAPWGHAMAITPGTNLGTIGVSPATSTVPVGVPVTSQNAAGQVTPVTVQFTLRELVTDWVFTIPWAITPAPSVTTGPDPSCNAGTDCAAAQLTIPAMNTVYAPYNPNGMSFSTDTSYDLNIVGAAFVPGSQTATCSPQQNASTLSNITPGQKLTAASLDFKGCQ